MISTDESIAVAELVVFTPVLIVMIFVLCRHGFSKKLGWIYLAQFAIIQIVGAGFEISAVHNPGNKTDIAWATILQTIGLGALILSSLGLLKRIIDQISTHVRGPRNDNVHAVISSVAVLEFIDMKGNATSRRSRVIQWIQIPNLTLTIVGLIGGINEASDSASDHKKGVAMLKSVIILFAVMYAVLVVLVVISVKEFYKMSADEKRIFVVLIIALPLIAVRILWSILAVFVQDRTFSLLNGNIAVRIAMANVEEFIVVIAYTILGLMTPRYMENLKTAALKAQPAPPTSYLRPQYSLPPRAPGSFFP